MANLTPEQMWQACCRNDASFDGHFYYGVRSTGIFCRPSCSSRIPSRENVVFFKAAAEAMAAGFRPCKRCRPDLGQAYQPQYELIEKACQIMQEEYLNLDPSSLAGRIGLSPYHFQRLFKRITGRTLGEYLRELRLKRAKELLLTTNLEITEIAYAAGFNSLSSFYAAFRKWAGVAPGQFRNENGEESKA